MENNRFYKNRHRIDEISRTQNVDAGVATSILIQEKGWTNYSAELNAWQNLMRKYQRSKDKTLADLFK